MYKKIIIPCLLISLVFSLSSWKKKDKKASIPTEADIAEVIKIETKEDSVSYIIGSAEGSRLTKDFEKSPISEIIDIKMFLNAFEDAALSKELKFEPDSNEQFIMEFNKSFGDYMMVYNNDTTDNKPKFDKSETYIDSIEYLMGAGYGKSVRMGMTQAGLDSIINMKIFVMGMKDGAFKDSLLLDYEEYASMVQEFFSEIQSKKAEESFIENKKAGEDYLAMNGALENVITTASGLQYEIITQGTGVKPIETDKVKVHYHGTLVDGTVFDSSVERGQPASFKVTQVISGWTEVLQLMPVGSKWKVSIPSELAYGTRSTGEIEPYSVLIFEIELLDIEK